MADTEENQRQDKQQFANATPFLSGDICWCLWANRQKRMFGSVAERPVVN
jgi:hypothetical protein